MARLLSQKPLIPQDENLDIHKRKVISGKFKTSKPESKKGGVGFGTRKPLGDITNKTTVHLESLSKKNNAPKEEFNIAEEQFLHDHRKCVEAQQAAKMHSFWDLVLPGYDPKSTVEVPGMKPVKDQHDQDFLTELSYPEPEEIELPEFFDSPRNSTSFELFEPPMSLESPPDFSFEINLDPVEFTLKEEDVC